MFLNSRGGRFAGLAGHGSSGDARSASSTIESSSEVSNGSIRQLYDTAVGKLPNEMLIEIAHHLPCKDQVSLALVNRQLRKVGEEVMYRFINLDSNNREPYRPYCYSDNGTSAPYDVLWLLHRTLSERSDLATLVKRFHVVVYPRTIHIEVPIADILYRAHPLVTTMQIPVKEGLIASSLVFTIMHELEDLVVHTEGASFVKISRREWGHFPSNHAITSYDLGLRKLKRLEYSGRDFDYALGSLPALVSLSLSKHCSLHVGKQAGGDPNTLHSLSIEQEHRILNSAISNGTELMRFVEQFDFLKQINIRICEPDYYDADDDREDPWGLGFHDNNVVFGRYAHLVAALTPVRATVETMIFDWDDTSTYSPWFRNICLPIDGLGEFSALRKLEIPYEGLLGSEFATGEYEPITTALPLTLEVLTVYYPKVHIYEWLCPLATAGKQLPYLKDIRLHCSKRHNDNYGAFLLVQHNEVEENLKRKRAIHISLSHPEVEDWNGYDAGTVRLSKWHSSLGNSKDSDPIILPPPRMPVPKMVTWKWIGNQERWYGRYHTCLQNRSWRETVKSLDPVCERQCVRRAWQFVAGRWVRMKVALDQAVGQEKRTDALGQGC